MKNQGSKPIAQGAYDLLADAYAARVETKAHNAYYERPAMLSLLPSVKGQRVLDAGCGPGVYSAWLVEHGADVLALDANEKMVLHARQRLGDRVRVVQANLEQPLDFLMDKSFDIVISPLVMDYIKDWQSLLGEFFRILATPGYLVFSIEHPYVKFFDHQQQSNYFKTELVEYDWSGFGTVVRVPSYRRPLSAVINPILTSGFVLDQLLEPVPLEDFKLEDPEGYAELVRKPGFLCVRAKKVNCAVA